MADSDEGCCKRCLGYIFSLGLTALFLWLSLRTSNPKCSIDSFYLPSLNRTLNDNTDSTLNITLRLENPNRVKGIKYEPLNVTVYDDPIRSHVMGHVLVEGFYQGHKKKATKLGTGIADTAMALKAVGGDGTGVFRVDMATVVRFKIMFWYTKKHRIMVGADVVVNGSGVKDYHGRIKLKSMAAPKMGSFCVVMGGLGSFLAFTLLNFL